LALPVSLFGPYKFQTWFLIATVLVAVSIFITRTGTVIENGKYEKRRVALVMLLFIFIYTCVTLLNTAPNIQPLNDSGFWLANRLLYLFGLAFFMPPLVEPLLERAASRTTDMTIVLATAILFCALVFFYIGQTEPCQASAGWYSSGNLADDSLMSVGIGLLLAVFTVAARKGEPDCPCR